MPSEITLRSPEEQRLLAALIADPDSDAPRLAYAAWLESRHPEHAEFIRLDCDLARRIPPPRWDHPAKKRQAELAARLEKSFCEAGIVCVTLRRGFVEAAMVQCTLPPDRFRAFFGAHPLLQRLFLYVERHDFRELAGLPELQRLTSLTLQHAPEASLPGDEVLAALLASPHLSSLRDLQLLSVAPAPPPPRRSPIPSRSADWNILAFPGIRLSMQKRPPPSPPAEGRPRWSR